MIEVNKQNNNKEVRVERNRKRFLEVGKFTNYLALPVIVLLVWNFSNKSGLFSTALLPSIGSVGESLVTQIQSGQLFEDMAISLSRVLKGFLLASFAGIFLGVAMGASKKVNRFFFVTINSVRQIPMMAWMPMIILWFGIDEASKVVIIFMGAFFPVLINTISGIKQVPEGYVEVAKMYRLSKWQVFKKVYFPSAMPSIFVGLKLALGISWSILVAAELVSASSGIGYRINDARSLMEAQVVIVGMISIGFIGIIMDQILGKVSKMVTPWIKNN